MLTTLSFLMLCSILFPEGAAAVRVGATLDLNSRIGREQKTAIEIAVDDFGSYVPDGLFLNVSNSSSKGYALHVVADIDPTSRIKLKVNVLFIAEDLVAEWGADAIISTGPWPEVIQIAKITNKARVPVLSLASSQPPTFASKPYLFWMSHSASGYVQCIADVIKLYGWRQVIILYEDDEYGSSSASTIPQLNDALQTVGSEIVKLVAFPPLDSLSDAKGLLHEQLERLTSELCKVFIVVRWSSPSLAKDLFKEAEALGMMDKGNVWIAGDDITSLLDSTFSPSFISSYMQGMIGIRTYVNDTNELYLNFSTKFQQKFQAEPGIVALQAYDAIQVIARAGAGAVAGVSLLKGIQLCKFSGLTGQVQFASEGGLVEGQGSPAFRIINFVGGSYREMGLWSKGTRFYGTTIGSLDMVWPGGRAGRPPGGWRKLRLGVPTNAVVDKFVKVEMDGNGNVTEVTGFCVDVFNEARLRLNYELDYDFHPFNGTSYNDLVAAVPERFDGAVGDVTIISKRIKNASFTEPFLPSGLTALVREKPETTRWVLTRPFTNKVWLLIAASFTYTCIVVWYLEQKDNPEFQGPWKTQLGATLWLIFCTIFFAHGKLHSYYTKIVVGAWLFVLLILTSAFTASLGSILTSQTLKPVFSERKVGCDGSSFAVEYLQEALHYKPEQIERIMSIENYAAAFESGNITKAYIETPYLRVFLAEYDGYAVHGDTKRLGGFGFVFPKGSPLAADFSKAILELAEDGILNLLEDKWFALSIGTCPITTKDVTKESLDLDSLWALFLITGAVSTIILLLFKTRFLPSYSYRSFKRASVPIRERCVSLWRYKLSKKRRVQLSRMPSSSHQVAPQPCDNSSGISEIHGHDTNNNLPNQNNV